MEHRLFNGVVSMGREGIYGTNSLLEQSCIINNHVLNINSKTKAKKEIP